LVVTIPPFSSTDILADARRVALDVGAPLPWSADVCHVGVAGSTRFARLGMDLLRQRIGI
jgi:hypothetical protein